MFGSCFALRCRNIKSDFGVAHRDSFLISVTLPEIEIAPRRISILHDSIHLHLFLRPRTGSTFSSCSPPAITLGRRGRTFPETRRHRSSSFLRPISVLTALRGAVLVNAAQFVGATPLMDWRNHPGSLPNLPPCRQHSRSLPPSYASSSYLKLFAKISMSIRSLYHLVFHIFSLSLFFAKFLGRVSLAVFTTFSCDINCRL